MLEFDAHHGYNTRDLDNLVNVFYRHQKKDDRSHENESKKQINEYQIKRRNHH